ncbi:MAG: 5'-nucleotidase C-terminal domain-containing protein [Sandaracinaceae bacterium]|nr:5'-nucleotidase C-terminal domain-containing protein [Sandaracinaceae bacterium]MBK8589181.1 5'-nucleotidase C-terminal domain-containing protein [Sandaracinaceae bacterium]
MPRPALVSVVIVLGVLLASALAAPLASAQDAPEDAAPTAESPASESAAPEAPPPVTASMRPADTASLPIAARLIITSGVGGHFTEPMCDANTSLSPSAFSKIAPHLESLRALDPLIFDTGGLLAPNAVSMYAARRAPDSYAQLIAELGYHALTFGEGELSADREALLGTLRALRDRGVPSIASNLRCDPSVPSAAALCEVLVDASDGVPMITRGNDRIALLTFIAEDAITRATPELSAGLRLTPIARAIGPAVQAARARGATLVVAVIDDAYGAEAAARILSLARQLPEAHRPDLLIAANAGSELLFARPVGFHPAVAAAPPAGGVRVDIRRNVEAASFDMLVRPLTPTPAPARAVTGFISRFGEIYCSTWGNDLPGGALSEDITGTQLLSLGASIIRQQSNAEIAIVNQGLLDSSWAPSRPRMLRASDVHVAIQYDEPLVSADVPGAWLLDVARRSARRPELVTLGMTIEGAGTVDESILVNGRTVEARGRYRVVTLRFLANGGDGLLPPLPAHHEWEPVLGPHATLRDGMLAYLHHPATRDPRERVHDLAEDAEWTFRVDGDLNFGGSSVQNRAAYDDSQLQRENTASFGFQINAAGNAQSPVYAWDNSLNLQYLLTRTSNSEGGYLEGDDQIRYRSTLRWRGFRTANDSWYVPEPFVEAYLETEFSQPAAREFRHMLLRTTVGAQFTLRPLLSVRLNGGVEVELLDPNRNALPGAGFVVNLDPWTLFETARQRVTGSFQADWFVSDLGGANRRTLRGTFDLAVALDYRFALAMTLQLYGVRAGSDPFAFASNVTASARVGWVGRAVR